MDIEVGMHTSPGPRCWGMTFRRVRRHGGGVNVSSCIMLKTDLRLGCWWAGHYCSRSCTEGTVAASPSRAGRKARPPDATQHAKRSCILRSLSQVGEHQSIRIAGAAANSGTSLCPEATRQCIPCCAETRMDHWEHKLHFPSSVCTLRLSNLVAAIRHPPLHLGHPDGVWSAECHTAQTGKLGRGRIPRLGPWQPNKFPAKNRGQKNTNFWPCKTLSEHYQNL